MPNDYFQFKQFLIKQDKCVMKVCTDACLFGGWISAKSLRLKAEGSKPKAENCIDVGSGTGLLSLMLAQKNNDAIIDAVEIDEAAAKQAKENFEASLWKERLNVYNQSIQQFADSAIRQFKYDIIICNPPFYESDLKSNDSKRNVALHSSELKLEELIIIADDLLKDDGIFFALLPYQRTEEFLKLAHQDFFIKEKVFVKQTPKHNYFRSMFSLMKQSVETHQSEIIIMNEDGKYANEFIALLKDYYL